MKIKKIIAGVAAAAMACTTMAAMSVSVSAINAGTVVDFEDGDCSFVYMNDLDGGTKATISVADYNGSKQLKIDPDECSKYSKIWFDLDTMMDRAVATQITKVEFDIAVVPDTEDGITDWVGAQIGSAGGFDRTGKNIQASQADPKWTDKSVDFTIPYDDFGNLAPGAATAKGGRSWIMKNEKYTLTGTNPFMCVMINPGTGEGRVGDYSVYIDNIKFMDEKGNALTMGVTPAAPAEEAAPEETAAAPAETEAVAAPVDDAAPVEDIAVDDDADEEVAAPAETAAPAPVAEPAAVEPAAAPAPAVATTPAATGNAAVASIAAVMAIAGAAAIVAKKRK